MSATADDVDVQSVEPVADRKVWIGIALVIVCIATVFRFAVNFASPYPPGSDAGYYPLQTRTWLLHGRLMYDDLPLLFWLNAALSKLLMAMGMTLDRAVLTASRMLDSAIEPWAAAGVMALGYVWSGGRRKALAGCSAAAVVAVLSPPVIRMLSDFEKNSAGFVFMCAAVWACRSAMSGRAPQSWLLLSGILALIAITHVGVFAATMAIVAMAIVIWCVLSLPAGKHRLIAAVCFVVVPAALIALLGLFDPSRAGKLIHSPLRLFRWPDLLVLPFPIILVAIILVAITVSMLLRDRVTLPAADIAIVNGLCAMVLFAVVPKSFDYFDRLFLMGMIPVSLLLAFIMARAHAARGVGFALLALALLAAAASPPAVQRPMMSNEVAAELLNIKRQITDPENTLIVAPHGLEWWAGYFLNTPVRSTTPAGSLSRYRRVLYLRNSPDCPPEMASPFGMPPVDKDATKIYFGHYLELYEAGNIK